MRTFRCRVERRVWTVGTLANGWIIILQPFWVNPAQRIPSHIGIGINPSPQPNRITLDIPPYRRIVIPVHVVRQVGLGVEVLAGEPQVEVEGSEVCGVFVRGVVAERVGVVPGPDDVALVVGDGPRRGEVVRMDVVQGLACAGDGSSMGSDSIDPECRSYSEARTATCA